MTNNIAHAPNGNYTAHTATDAQAQPQHRPTAVIKGRKVENMFELIPTSLLAPDAAEILFRKTLLPTTKRVSQSNMQEKQKEKQFEKTAHPLQSNRPKTQSVKPGNPHHFIKPSPVKARPAAKSNNKGTKHAKRKKRNTKINQLMGEYKNIDTKKSDIPFSQNRYNGQYNELAPTLLKRNKEYLAKQKAKGTNEKDKEYQKMIKRKEEGIKVQQLNKDIYSKQKKKMDEAAEQGVEIEVNDEKIRQGEEIIQQLKNRNSLFSPYFLSPQRNTLRKERSSTISQQPLINALKSPVDENEKKRRATLVQKQKQERKKRENEENQKKAHEKTKKINELERLNKEIISINKNIRQTKKKHRRKRPRSFSDDSESVIPQERLNEILKPILSSRGPAKYQQIIDEIEETDPTDAVNRPKSITAQSLHNNWVKSSAEQNKPLVIQKNNFFQKVEKIREKQNMISARINEKNNKKQSTTKSESYEQYKTNLKDKIATLAKRLENIENKEATIPKQCIIIIQSCLRKYLIRKKCTLFIKVQNEEKFTAQDRNIQIHKVPHTSPQKSSENLCAIDNNEDEKSNKKEEQQTDVESKMIQQNREQLATLVEINKQYMEMFKSLADKIIPKSAEKRNLEENEQMATNFTKSAQRIDQMFSPDYMKEIQEQVNIISKKDSTEIENKKAEILKIKREAEALMKIKQQAIQEGIRKQQELMEEEEKARIDLEEAKKINVQEIIDEIIKSSPPNKPTAQVLNDKHVDKETLQQDNHHLNEFSIKDKGDDKSKDDKSLSISHDGEICTQLEENVGAKKYENKNNNLHESPNTYNAPENNSSELTNEAKVDYSENKENMNKEKENEHASTQEVDMRTQQANVITDQILSDLLSTLKKDMFPTRKARKGIPTDYNYITKYIDEVYEVVRQNIDTFQANISVPINRSPLFILAQIQNEEAQYLEGIDDIISVPVLPIEWYIDIEKTKREKANASRKPENDTIALQEEQQVSEYTNIHNKCIFDALNDALDIFRPLGLKGPPLPWSSKFRELNVRVTSVEKVLQKAKEKVIQWCRINAGCITLDAKMNEMIPEMMFPEGERLNIIREERLACILATEINENEESWIDYELEETQVKFDVADMIIDQLLSETADILSKLSEARNAN